MLKCSQGDVQGDVHVCTSPAHSQVLEALEEIAFQPEFLPNRIEKERKAVMAEAQVSDHQGAPSGSCSIRRLSGWCNQQSLQPAEWGVEESGLGEYA
jgi:hypothetical protein